MIGGPAGQQVLQSVQVGDSGHPLDTDHPLGSGIDRVADADGHGGMAGAQVGKRHFRTIRPTVKSDQRQPGSTPVAELQTEQMGRNTHDLSQAQTRVSIPTVIDGKLSVMQTQVPRRVCADLKDLLTLQCLSRNHRLRHPATNDLNGSICLQSSTS